jgi:hypothetical protein
VGSEWDRCALGPQPGNEVTVLAPHSSLRAALRWTSQDKYVFGVLPTADFSLPTLNSSVGSRGAQALNAFFGVSYARDNFKFRQ